MEQLLFGLTPAEFWVWNYLILLAMRQQSNHIILPKPGEDRQVEKIFSRKHVKRLLKSLKVKRHITHIIFPRSKSKQIELFMPASKIGDLYVPNKEKGYMEVPKKEERGATVSPIKRLGTCRSRITSEGSTTYPESAPHKLELKEEIKRLLKLKQGELKKTLGGMGTLVLVDLEKVLGMICRHEPKGRKLSIQAKIYAVIRFLQERETISKPQAWIDTVARQGEREMEEARWKDDSSGNAGRLRFPGKCAEG
jgi:hypothetical protein